MNILLEKTLGFPYIKSNNPKERRNPMSEVIIDLQLKFTIPDSGLTINGIIQGVNYHP